MLDGLQLAYTILNLIYVLVQYNDLKLLCMADPTPGPGSMLFPSQSAAPPFNLHPQGELCVTRGGHSNSCDLYM